MGAAIEGSMEGIKSIGFSLLDYHHDADFSQSVDFIRKIIADTLKTSIPKGVSLNVNIPKAKKEDIKGVKMCTQADAYWVEEYIARKDPWNGDYYWLSGEFKTDHVSIDSDIHALEQNYISIVPIQYDLTASNMIEKLNHFNS
jgi:5'-nucleotidase